ncbi:MAG: hypothetical protein DPW09_11155 [Anaerolineae bacterium]|nr:hypothetical protein [Anaerolineae bacterium]
MSTKNLIFGYLKGLLQRWYLVALAIFDFIGLLVQPFLPYQFPVWGNLIVFALVFILANYLLYREGQEEIFALKELYDGKVSELKEKIKELENRRPVLDLFFQVDQGLSRLQVIEVFNVPSQPNFDEVVHQEADALKRAYVEEGKSVPSSGLAGLQAVLAQSIFRQRKTADEYEKECERYLKLYRQYLISSYNYDIRSARFRNVSFAVQNSGTVPAEDITVFIHSFPKCVFCRSK